MRVSVSKPIKDIKQTFCKIKCHARQAHVLCSLSWAPFRAPYKFAQNIPHIMSHLRDVLAVYDRTQRSWGQ